MISCLKSNEVIGFQYFTTCKINHWFNYRQLKTCDIIGFWMRSSIFADILTPNMMPNLKSGSQQPKKNAVFSHKVVGKAGVT